METNGSKHPLTKNLVFIFKAPKDSNTSDKYEEILNGNHIPAVCIPVLTFDFVNIAELTAYLSTPETLSGIILTSTRSVQAVASGLQEVSGHCDLFNLIQCFVIGPATHEAAIDLGFQSEGKEAGNGEALVSYILDNIKDPSKPLLYPCSSLHREKVPKILRNEGLTVIEVVSYETHPDEHIGDHVNIAVKTKGIPEYTVFFSPSGFHSVDNSSTTLPFSLANTKMIALGPTTASAVTDKGYKLHGMTKKPDPDSLLALLQKSISGKL